MYTKPWHNCHELSHVTSKYFAIMNKHKTQYIIAIRIDVQQDAKKKNKAFATCFFNNASILPKN
jgi:hypothetical protein